MSPTPGSGLIPPSARVCGPGTIAGVTARTSSKSPRSAAAARNDKYARWPSLRLYDLLGVPYVLGNIDWDGPLWTGHCMMLDTTDRFGDAGFFHELCHWLAASPAQRSWPDFGIDRQVNSDLEVFASSASPYAYVSDRDDQHRGWGGATRNPTVSQAQEDVACRALGAYEPLVGIWSWEHAPESQELNEALSAFSGMEGPNFTAPVVRRIYDVVSSQVAPDVPFAVLAAYLARVHEVTASQRHPRG